MVVLRIVACEQAGRAVELSDPQRPATHVGESRCGRIRTRVVHRTPDRDWACLAAQQTGSEEPAAECERCDLAICIGRVCGDPGRAVSCAFAPSEFLVGDVRAGWVIETEYSYQSLWRACEAKTTEPGSARHSREPPTSWAG